MSGGANPSEPVGMGGVLERILATTREDVQRRRRELPADRLAHEAAERRRAGTRRGRFADALRRPGMAIVAEHKRRSPSAGALRARTSVAEIVKAYERGGASALSVLTEERSFDGSLADLRIARAASDLPILRKDFILDSYQLLEAAAAGADAVLLIVAALPADTLTMLAAEAQRLELDVLVEAHDPEEVDVAVSVPGAIIGINNRDLTDFSVDVARTFELLGRIPSGRVVISESGICRRGQLEELARAGVHGVLVGEVLMRADDPEVACRALARAR